MNYKTCAELKCAAMFNSFFSAISMFYLNNQPMLKTQYFWSWLVPILKVNLLKTDQVCCLLCG